MTTTQQPELPALPRGVERVQIIAGYMGGFETDGWAVPFRLYYTKAQMQAYAQAAVLADRERRETGPVPYEIRAFLADLSEQKPEKPDYWSSCGQCDHNIDRAQELLPLLAPSKVEDRG